MNREGYKGASKGEEQREGDGKLPDFVRLAFSRFV